MKKKTKVEYVALPQMQQNNLEGFFGAWNNVNATLFKTRISVAPKAKALSKKELRAKHWEKVDELFW